jgi:hypothetical protein
MAVAIQQISPVAHLPLVLGVVRKLNVAALIDTFCPPVVRKNSLFTPLDDVPSTCDNKEEGILLPVIEGHIGNDTMPALAPHPVPDHWHALDAAWR